MTTPLYRAPSARLARHPLAVEPGRRLRLWQDWMRASVPEHGEVHSRLAA